MKKLTAVVVAVSVGMVGACSDDDGGGVRGNGGTGATAGSAGAAGSAGTGGTGGAAGAAGTSAGGTGGTTPPPPPPTPALPANAETVACPTVINGSLEASDATQTGRHSRIPPVSACGMTKPFPGNAADPSNPHLFDVYRFANPGSAATCFTFTLSYGLPVLADAGDAGPDASAPVDAGGDGLLDAGDASAAPPVVNPEPVKYLTAYGTFFPTDLSLEFLGDVGDTLAPPHTMGITVPAGETIDVVVYAVDNAPAGAGSYTLSCSTQ